MATFPALTPSDAPIAPGAWPATAHKSLNGAESSIRHGSAEIGRRWRPLFVNITEANFLAILAHYRGQRSGFDSFGFTTTTLAADLTPAGFAWLYASRPQVIDEHTDCFTVQCEFRCEPRGLVVAPGKAWRTGATTFTTGTTSGDGAVSAAGVNWVTPATTFTAGGAGSGGGGIGTALLSFTGSTLQIGRPLFCGFTFTLSESKTIKGVGFYDQGQSGLSAHNYIDLTDVNDVWTPISFDAAGNKEFIVIPNGTAAPLSGPWRRVDLSTAGRVLQTGITYALITYMGVDPSDENASVSSLVDYVVKNATGVTVLSGASYVNNIWDIGGYPNGEIVTNSSAGTAFFGPMIFFE